MKCLFLTVNFLNYFTNLKLKLIFSAFRTPLVFINMTRANVHYEALGISVLVFADGVHEIIILMILTKEFTMHLHSIYFFYLSLSLTFTLCRIKWHLMWFQVEPTEHPSTHSPRRWLLKTQRPSLGLFWGTVKDMADSCRTSSL